MVDAVVYAYACVPDQGSEPGAGWAWASAVAAAGYRVTLITDAEHLRGYTDEDLLHRGGFTRIIRLDGPFSAISIGSRMRHLRYLGWIWRAARLAGTDFPSAAIHHHLTYASDWLPSPAFFAPRTARVVWGPVGGGTYPPRALTRHLPRAARLREVVRRASTSLVRRSTRALVTRRVDVLVAMNADTARHFRHHPNVVVEPNVVVDLPQHHERPDRGRPYRAVYAGRLLDMKGVQLAVASLSHPAASGWDLHIFGEGPASARLQAQARQLGVERRVHFAGRVDRATVLKALGEADALVFPSFHDSASWTVAEAVTVGTPVICLDIGGPPAIASEGGWTLPLTCHLPQAIAESLAAIAHAGPPPPSTRWSSDRLPPLIRKMYGP